MSAHTSDERERGRGRVSAHTVRGALCTVRGELAVRVRGGWRAFGVRGSAGCLCACTCTRLKSGAGYTALHHNRTGRMRMSWGCRTYEYRAYISRGKGGASHAPQGNNLTNDVIYDMINGVIHDDDDDDAANANEHSRLRTEGSNSSSDEELELSHLAAQLAEPPTATACRATQ